ncbi:hypothetical protein CYMTET_28479 [Cymbomonas tetramitiformis]|uniref:L domain-like protein n=1 Tax=Cymbomonas tetramitiformis TaxID=36881 RepID=A0AAE0FP92_9CHLO|nr:hypothetical protein CYMTET_28479 [Cymbomonas tetramitiformis]
MIRRRCERIIAAETRAVWILLELILSLLYDTARGETLEQFLRYLNCDTCKALEGNGALSGTIPTEIGNLARLTTMSFWGDSLTSTIPTELGGLADLRTINFGYNSLTGTIPTELGGLANMNVEGNQAMCGERNLPATVILVSAATAIGSRISHHIANRVP